MSVPSVDQRHVRGDRRARAAADEPPVTRSGSHGLWHGAVVDVLGGRRRSPTRTCAACRAAPRRLSRSRCHTGASAVGHAVAHEVVVPAVIGTPGDLDVVLQRDRASPASGPSGSPRRAASSIRCACSQRRLGGDRAKRVEFAVGPLDALQVRLGQRHRRQLARDDPLEGLRDREVRRRSATASPSHAEDSCCPRQTRGSWTGSSLPSSRENTSLSDWRPLRELRISARCSRSPPRRSPACSRRRRSRRRRRGPARSW